MEIISTMRRRDRYFYSYGSEYTEDANGFDPEDTNGFDSEDTNGFDFEQTTESLTYLKNNLELRNLETNKLIDELAFKSLIKEEVSYFINRSFDNIIVLAGAGSSVVSIGSGIDKQYGRTVSDLTGEINKALLDNASSLITLASQINCHYDLNFDFDHSVKINFEDFLSDLIAYEKYVPENKKKSYIESKEIVFKTIKDATIYNYNHEKHKHAGFIRTLANKVKSPNKLTIVTTNYDTLFEEAAADINYTVMDGFTFSSEPEFDSDMFDWNLIRDIENIKTKEHEYKRNILNLLKIHGSLTWEKSGSKIYRKDKNKIDNPIMIFPSSNKYMQSYQEPYFELFTKFQEYLKKPNTLLITCGFSFQDNHIFKMIMRAIKHNKGLYTLVTDIDIEQNTANWKQLEKLIEDKYQIAFLKASMNDDLIDYLGECNNDSR